MSPPTRIATTPFRNSPSIDTLSPRRGSFGLGRASSDDGSCDTLRMVGNPKIGSDVPLDLLRSLIVSGTTTTGGTGANETLVGSLQAPSSSSGDGIGSSSPVVVTPEQQGENRTYEARLTIARQWTTQTVAYSPSHTFAPVKHLPVHIRKRILVTGGAGFVGSHLVDRLMLMGHDVTVLDNFFSGSKTAVSHWIGHPNFELVRHDVVDPFMIECDQIYHLACPASPVAYQYNAIKTMKTNFLGTMNMLGLAKRTKARFLLSSTSEVYGSPEQHPQKETYWGNVNPIGPRACYDEGKRVAEALTYGYATENGVQVRVARIFNTYGPRMSPSDGRLVSNFIMRALERHPIEIYGDGQQTRSLMFIFDLIDGLIELMNSDDPRVIQGPVNLGSSDEQSVEEWAKMVLEIVKEISGTNSNSGQKQTGHREAGEDQLEIVYKEGLPDDPPRRKPDTTRALETLGWSPRWSSRDGLTDTVKFFMKMHK